MLQSLTLLISALAAVSRSLAATAPGSGCNCCYRSPHEGLDSSSTGCEDAGENSQATNKGQKIQ
ncbi:hypothetical protein OESDEN_18499 [Oesophagostomum dentatum]|uniref:Uncharacterized protein n=1 Tax=Oesophagostomum dentatum TaxID=61180 RepID=A0A0B1SE37_OESDE|nr:hypothetical protein OESDEN_18499 [Oesophagostomum dentatum]